MSFIPVSGPARFLPAERPKDSSIEFNDDRRSIVLPLRGALPVLAKARDNNDAHPSVQLLAGTALLGLQLVAAGKFAPDETGTKWQVAGLEAKDEQRILDLATARTHQDFDSATAEGYVRAMLEALADLLPDDIVNRTKQPYRAPDSQSFFFDGKPLDYVADLMSESRIRDAGYFDAAAVNRLFEKCRQGRATGFADNQAFVGILSTMLVHQETEAIRQPNP